MSIIFARHEAETHEREEGPQRRLIDSRLAVWIVRLIVLAVVLAGWEWYGHRVNAALFAPPSAVAKAAYRDTIHNGDLFQALGEMNRPLFEGFGAAIVVGLIVGLAMGHWRPVWHLANPYVSFLYSLPEVSLIPVLVLWIGLGQMLGVVLVFIAAVLPIIINTSVGVRQVDQGLRDVSKAAGASTTQQLRTVLLPGTLPYALAGIHTGLAQGLIAIIVAEMTAELTGLGGLILTYSNFFQTADMFVPIITIGVESVILMDILKRLRRWLAPWSVVEGPGRNI